MHGFERFSENVCLEIQQVRELRPVSSESNWIDKGENLFSVSCGFWILHHFEAMNRFLCLWVWGIVCLLFSWLLFTVRVIVMLLLCRVPASFVKQNESVTNAIWIEMLTDLHNLHGMIIQRSSKSSRSSFNNITEVITKIYREKQV
jgi:hypothetical protein